jgi:hypothetical protein
LSAAVPDLKLPSEETCHKPTPTLETHTEMAPKIAATLEDGPLEDRSIPTLLVEGRPPKTIDARAEDGSTCRYCLADWVQRGRSAVYTFLYRVFLGRDSRPRVRQHRRHTAELAPFRLEFGRRNGPPGQALDAEGNEPRSVSISCLQGVLIGLESRLNRDRDRAPS